MSAVKSHHASSTPSMLLQARRALLARKTALLGGAEPEGQAELAELEAALGRIENGTWGRCEICGGAIGRTRLRALPEARHCLACARGV